MINRIDSDTVAFGNQSLEKKTIEDVTKIGLCTGCGTCIAICPNSSIMLDIDGRNGLYIPRIRPENCSKCGICYESCPGYSVDFRKLNLEIFGEEPNNSLIGNYIKCYTGHATNYDIRYNAASGGLVTQMLIFALEEGYINGALVVRMKKENPLEAESFIAKTREEIIEASKSKYCPVPANISLKKILESNDNDKFAIVGLPCHIHGVRKAELLNKKLKEKIILHLGIFCAQSINFWGIEFLLDRLKIERDTVHKIDYRGKGWPGGMSIKLRNGAKLFIPKSDYYDGRFGSFFPSRCLVCGDHSCELADISFGDARLPEFVSDKIGKSIIITRKNIAEEILQRMSSRKIIELNEIDSHKVGQSQEMFRFKRSRLNTRIFFSRLIGRKIPNYNRRLPQPVLSDYLMTIWLYLWIYIAARKYLWAIFTMRIWIAGWMGYFRSVRRGRND